MSITKIKDVVLVNGANESLPGGTTLDGGNIVYQNVADPINGTDAANKQWVESNIPFVPTPAETIFYIAQESDLGTTQTLADGNDYYVLDTGVYIIVNAIDLTLGTISFSPGSRVSIQGYSNTTISEGYTVFNSELSPGFSFSTVSLPQPLFYSDNVNYPSLLIIKNITTKEEASFTVSPNFQLGNDTLSNDMTIYIDNTILSIPGSINGQVGEFNGGSSNSLLKITNCDFTQSVSGPSIKNFQKVIFSNNTCARVGTGTDPIIKIWGDNTGRHLYNNSLIESNGTGLSVESFQIIGNSATSSENIPDNSSININNINGIGTNVSSTFFDLSELNENDKRINTSNNIGVKNSSAAFQAYNIDNTTVRIPYNQIRTGSAPNVPQVVETVIGAGVPSGNWTIDTTTLSRFNVTIGQILQAEVSNGSPGSLETVIGEFNGQFPMRFKVRFSCIVDGPGMGSDYYGFGLFLKSTGSSLYFPIDDSFNTFAEGGDRNSLSNYLVNLNPGDMITPGFLTTDTNFAPHNAFELRFIVTPA